jgi:orotidine-5'-phosphate decarboxylase
MSNFADRLVEAVCRKRTPAVVGLDPRPDLMPASIIQRYALAGSAAPPLWARAVEEFCCRVLDVVAPLVPAVKMQSAFFELHGAPGIAALSAVTRKAQRLGLVTILDAKRGDIGSTCEAYADAAFRRIDQAAKPLTGMAGGLNADALTVNPYLGRDSLDPFLDFARRGSSGLFVLVRTSNPGSSDLQQLATAQAGRPVYSHVAQWVREWSEATRGASGYSAVGAVVGGTAREQIVECRRAMPGAVLLIPGYGAQGAAASDIAAAFDERGLGAIVNSSRGILFPRASTDQVARDWEANVERAAREMIADLAHHTPAGRLQSA